MKDRPKILNAIQARMLIGEHLSKKNPSAKIPVNRKTLYNFMELGLPHELDGNLHFCFSREKILAWLSDYKVPPKG